MMIQKRNRFPCFVHAEMGSRRGAAIIEMAIIGPVFFLILISLIVGGLGVFRYHQVAALAYESARWTSVHGQNYSRVTGQPPADSEALMSNVIRPRASGLDLSQLTCDLKWNAAGSAATVTIRYQWTPEALWLPIVITCEATTFVTY